jgi:hypothetical protein
MAVLAALGLRPSEELIAPSEENPAGFFEDARIVRVQADLLRALDAWPFHPLPRDWQSRPAAIQAKESLRALLKEGMGGIPGLWGIKDPRTCSFLPLWQELFREEDIAPRYLLALRDLGGIVRSFQRAYGVPPALSEDVWLRRVGDALLHTRAQCHIVQYEDWFTRPQETAEALARYTGLACPAKLPPHLIQHDLDRCGGAAYKAQNADAARLHMALQGSRGNNFDADRLLRQAAACRG